MFYSSEILIPDLLMYRLANKDWQVCQGLEFHQQFQIFPVYENSSLYVIMTIKIQKSSNMRSGSAES